MLTNGSEEGEGGVAAKAVPPAAGGHRDARRWLILAVAWVVAGLLLVQHTIAVRNYLAFTGRMGLRGAPVAPTPLKRTSLSWANDAQVWIRHAVNMAEDHTWRLRHTDIDNPPDGREVHWSSIWALTIEAAGRVRQAFTGEPLPTAIEEGAVWLNAVVLAIVLVIFSTVILRRFGAPAAVLAIAAMLGSYPFYEGFTPSYVDHHGLATASTFGLVLGAALMGAGWWRGDEARDLLPWSSQLARRGAVFSAAWGAFGMWISASSVVPSIAAVGVSGLALGMVAGPRMTRAGVTFDARSWRLWGRVGGGLSLLFYLFEYFPDHLSMRLDVNHPLHALAWFGGGELIAELIARRISAPEARWRSPWQLALPALAFLCAPLVGLLGGPSVFALKDPFLAAVHRNIMEFKPLATVVRSYELSSALRLLLPQAAPFVAAAAVIAVRPLRDRWVFWFSFVVAAELVGMALWHVRGFDAATASILCLMVLLFVRVSMRWRPGFQWLLAAAMAAVLYVPEIAARSRVLNRVVASGRLDSKDKLQPFFRDIAAIIRVTQPNGKIVLLASPNSSVAIGYYGRFTTVGTLYWENAEGLRKAAEIFSALTETEALKLVRKYGVTHIAMVTEDNFVPEYFELMHPGASSRRVKDSFGGYLFLAKSDFPPWLVPIPYEFPPDLKDMPVSIRLYKVVPTAVP